MPEGDTVHRWARRIEVALGGRELGLADAPNPRSPLHTRAGELEGRTVEGAEAYGKHLLIHFSGGAVVHSHAGMNGRWWVTADGRLPYGKPWLRLGSGRAIASQTNGKLLRLVSESRARNDPQLARLGPDPLRPGFDRAAAARRLLAAGPRREVGEALNDQSVIAGIGNVIRVGSLFGAGVSPWRKLAELEPDEAEQVVAEAERIMRVALRTGRRPRSIYKAERRGCPRCGGPVSVTGQGDANRVTYWCPRCQR